jgi:general secretion pathway protein C
LFGGQVAVASATNYQLTGVVAAGGNSAAIIVAEGSPPKALVVGKEVSPGVTLAEVHPRYVMLSDNGVMKRIDLAPDTKGAAPMGGGPSDNPAAPMSNVNNAATPIMAPPANAPTGNAVAEPPMAPGAVQQQMPVTPTDASVQQQNPNVAPVNNPNNPGNQNNPNNPNAVNPANQAPAPVQMPPPTRAVNPNPGAVAPAVR